MSFARGEVQKKTARALALAVSGVPLGYD